MRDWLSGPRAAVTSFTAGAIMFSIGTYIATHQVMGSTYICFAPLDSRSQTTLLQYVGLVLDATAIVHLWRILAWTRSVKLRLRTLSNILLTSSLLLLPVWTFARLFSSGPQSSVGFGFLYGFDVLVDSFAFATLTIGLSVWTCETNPVVSTAVTTFLYGTWRAGVNVFNLGGWMYLSRSASLGPLWLITCGLAIFLYAHDIRSVVFIRRTLFVAFMASILITATIFTFVRPISRFEKRHPINDLIYEARVIHDRWLVKAATSTTLATAVMTYEERHGGRPPPPKFGDWYQYASGSAVIDEFQQIDSDLDIFWSLSPENLRKRVLSALANPDVGSIIVADGQVTMNSSGNHVENLDLRELADMIQKFSRHLPDMVLPINLNLVPRVLPSWTNTQLHSRSYLHSMAKIISKRSQNGSAPFGEVFGSGYAELRERDPIRYQTWVKHFRRAHAEACPSTSRAQTSPHWNIGRFCAGCVKDHSRGQLLDNWQRSLDLCAQPDLNHLHSFAMTDLGVAPIQDLVPLFGPSKTGGFRDILIPLSQSQQNRPDDLEPFSKRKDTLFWRSTIGTHGINEQSTRGSHKLRLLHLINNADTRDRVTMILPVLGVDNQFRSESVSVREANRDLSFDVSASDLSACKGKNCDAIKKAYGTGGQLEDPFKYRYVLVTDEDDGPPATMLTMLHSQCLPFISTIFKTWYTDRLTPWLHFVPIDPRYQALHTTLLYFTGTANKAKMKGINTYLKGRSSDAEWIAQQGQRWANKSLGKKDMEIYLFRLLLEWGRLIDDRRDEIGYRKRSNGEFQGDEWTR
ncbi:glycosyltransferase family 90 protein [Pochonia chlamydosporia 170]|uniref:Glycosyltransferase family 90 protein n=1 Tax=Pochonia chlamydosporia 170 TaxID=1380566 RepID=A0A179G6L1_METCM|nr:glycosyltransferase family 90 protein [Pochonia chlamydosporia 170]OAQ73424.1 glycosyltransferase family 90 protein [Pochonia chlamydosporia 170]